MQRTFFWFVKWSVIFWSLLCLVGLVQARETAEEITREILERNRTSGFLARAKVEIRRPGTASGEAEVLQIQIKGRSTSVGSDLLYQILWPENRRGEAVLVKSRDGKFQGGVIYVPWDNDRVEKLARGDLGRPLFANTNIILEDVAQGFWSWPEQKLVGEERIGEVECVVLESRPGGGVRSVYSHVQSVIDPERLLPLVVRKFAGGQVARELITTHSKKEDSDYYAPAKLVIKTPDGVETEIAGSRAKRGLDYGDEEFTVEAMKELAP